MSWFGYAPVIAEAGNPTFSSLGFANDAAMQTHITTYIIPTAQNLCEQFLNKTYLADGSDVPAGVKNIALRISAAALIKIAVRKMSTLVRVEDWRVELSRQDIFTPELKDELREYFSKTPIVKATSYKTSGVKTEWDE